MKRMLQTLCLGVSFVALAGLTGCDRTEHHRAVDVDDDKVTTTDTVIRDRGDTTQIEKRVTEKEYDDGKIKTETKTQVETLPKP